MKSVVICGSQRFKNEIYDFAMKLEKLGAPLVFQPNFDTHEHLFKKEESERLKDETYRIQVPGMVHAHFERIRKADVCFVYNKDRYLGVNTTLEVGYAHGQGMVIYALEPECTEEEVGEICRHILFTDIVKTPEELIKRLV